MKGSDFAVPLRLRQKRPLVNENTESDSEVHIAKKKRLE
jgi:hypothetical protein